MKGNHLYWNPGNWKFRQKQPKKPGIWYIFKINLKYLELRTTLNAKLWILNDIKNTKIKFLT